MAVVAIFGGWGLGEGTGWLWWLWLFVYMACLLCTEGIRWREGVVVAVRGGLYCAAVRLWMCREAEEEGGGG